MTVYLHPPERVGFEGDVSEDDRRRIAAALRGAVLRALEQVAAAGIQHPGARQEQDVAELFDPERFDPDRRTYRVPSYDDQGQLTETQLLQAIPESDQNYGIHDGPSVLQGKLILAGTGGRYVFLRSPRYAFSGSLTLAYQLGLNLFGATSFAILQGPWEQPPTLYLTVGTEPGVDAADVGRGATLREAPTEEGKEGKQVEVGGEKVEVWSSILVPRLSTDIGTYLLRGFVTRDRHIRWPNPLLAGEWKAQVQMEAREGVEMPRGSEARGLLFDDVDAIVDQVEAGDDRNLQQAADYLARFDSNAFGLVPWERKAKYLKVLLAAWTWQEQEKAVVQIFKSLDNDGEVDAVIDELKRAGRYDQLFDDLDNELYGLLVTVGGKFPKDRSPLTFEGLVRLLDSMGVLQKLPTEVLSQVMGPAGQMMVPGELLDEAHDAVMGLVRFGVDLGESLVTIFTDPDKVVQGISAMVQLLVKAQLAELGYLPAIEEIGKFLAGIGEQVLAGMRGADRLGCGQKVVRRIKWRLVWEIASLFIGVGELKAIAQGLGLGEKLAGVIRFLGVLARLGEVVDAEAEAARLARLAALLKEERAIFGTVEEASELLSHLSEDDVRKLGRLLRELDLKEGESLADLASRAPKLHAAVEDAAAKMELLKTLAGKGAGLNEEAVTAFQRLVGSDGLELGAARKVVDAIPAGEGARFAAALERVPLGRLTGSARSALLELLAGSTRRMDAVTRLGFDTFASIYRRAAGRAEAIDRYLGAVEGLEARFGQQGRQAELRRLLDALERDDPAAWLEVENERRIAAGQRPIGPWASQLSGSPKARSALDKLIRREGGDGVVDSLIDQLGGDRGLISDAEVVLALEKLDELGPRELDGVMELQRYLARGERLPQWDEILFTEPARRRELLEVIGELRDPANPGRLVVQDGLGEVLEAALRQRNVQGGLAHFQAVRSLLREFPGASFRLEVTRLTGGWREVDIVMNVGGRSVDVEVKGYQVTTGLDHVRRQISKDLASHLGDAGGPFSDMLWRFADPMYASNFPTVERIFLEELGRLGLSPADLARAQTALRARFTAPPPWRLIDVLR